MGWSFRKRISLGKGLRVNLGKRGASVSAGRGLFGFNTGQIVRWGGKGKISPPSEPLGCGGCLVTLAALGCLVWGVIYLGGILFDSRPAAPSRPAVVASAAVGEPLPVQDAGAEQGPSESIGLEGNLELETAKAERTATAKLKAAKGLLSVNKKAAVERLKEIVEKYPDTGAATEAAQLLKK